jgi:hypothetical protein
MWWSILSCFAFGISYWASGAYEKYPELLLPFFMVYLNIVILQHTLQGVIDGGSAKKL